MFPGGILLGASFLSSPCLFLSHTSRGKEPDPSEFFCLHWSQGDADVSYLVGLSRTNKVTQEQLFATPQFPSGLQAPYLPLCLNTHAQTDTCIESPYMHIRADKSRSFISSPLHTCDSCQGSSFCPQCLVGYKVRPLGMSQK